DRGRRRRGQRQHGLDGRRGLRARPDAGDLRRSRRRGRTGAAQRPPRPAARPPVRRHPLAAARDRDDRPPPPPVGYFAGALAGADDGGASGIWFAAQLTAASEPGFFEVSCETKSTLLSAPESTFEMRSVNSACFSGVSVGSLPTLSAGQL